jgi:hypothetical protein
LLVVHRVLLLVDEGRVLVAVGLVAARLTVDGGLLRVDGLGRNVGAGSSSGCAVLGASDGLRAGGDGVFVFVEEAHCSKSEVVEESKRQSGRVGLQ